MPLNESIDIMSAPVKRTARVNIKRTQCTKNGGERETFPHSPYQAGDFWKIEAGRRCDAEFLCWQT